MEPPSYIECAHWKVLENLVEQGMVFSEMAVLREIG